VVQLLLSSGADASKNCLALQLACENGHEDVVLHLLKCKAKINPNRDEPLLAAMKHNHESIVRLLVARGADINAYSSSGTVLHVAAYQGLTSLAKIFIEKGADVNFERGVSCSASFLAPFAGNKDIVEMLIKENADVNGESNDGSHYTKIYNIGCPLHAAALQGHEDITRILIRNGAAVNKIEGRYSTPLLAASINGHEKIVWILLDEGADVSIPQETFEFDTALQTAAYGGFENIVQLLLQNGADVNREGGKYGTAIQAAADHQGYLNSK
jgi:ankyrin repeat protein